MTDTQLRAAIADLLKIEADGNLGDLLIAFSNQCRKHGGLPAKGDRQRIAKSMQPGAVFRARAVAKAAAHLFGVSFSECERFAKQSLVEDPWSAIALDVIEGFLPEQKQSVRVAPSTAMANARRRRAQ